MGRLSAIELTLLGEGRKDQILSSSEVNGVDCCPNMICHNKYKQATTGSRERENQGAGKARASKSRTISVLQASEIASKLEQDALSFKLQRAKHGPKKDLDLVPYL